VLLSRLRIRGKLTLLVMIPLLAMVGLVLPVVRQLVAAAGKATDIDAAVTVAGRMGSLLQDVQRERLLSVGFLLGVVPEDDLVVQTADVTDRIRDIRLDLSDALPAAVTAGIDQAQKLDPLRQRIRVRSATPRQVLDGFEPVVDNMIDSLRLSRHADGGTAAGRQLNALDALLRMDESRTESTALLTVMTAGDLEHQYLHYREEAAEYDTFLDRFTDNATPPQLKLYDLWRPDSAAASATTSTPSSTPIRSRRWRRCRSPRCSRPSSRSASWAGSSRSVSSTTSPRWWPTSGGNSSPSRTGSALSPCSCCSVC
jgi:hypothetical protein